MAFLRVKKMGYPNSPYSGNGMGNTTPVSPMDFTGSDGSFTPQGYLESLLSMRRFTPEMNLPGMPPDALNTPLFPTAGNEFTAPAMTAMNSFKGTPNWFDTLKGWGGKAAGSFLPKINPETGKMETLGWGMPALQGLSSLGNMYLGMKNYGLAKDQLNTQKEQFAMNYNNQRQLLNTQMEDMARARASASSKVESPESYMARNRIK